MDRRGVFWAVVMLVLVALAFVVPYTLLSGVDAWYGSFLFWTLFGAAAIAVNAIVTASWRD
jgi:cyanate permease